MKKWFTRHETDRFLNNHCLECVRAYLSIHDCLSFHEVISTIIGTKQPKVNQSPQRNGEDDKHAHGFAYL
jgi:hypothetical protein